MVLADREQKVCVYVFVFWLVLSCFLGGGGGGGGGGAPLKVTVSTATTINKRQYLNMAAGLLIIVTPKMAICDC